MRDFGPEITWRNARWQGGSLALHVPKIARETGASRALREVLVNGFTHPCFESLVEVVG
jgi:hypothetical protein